MPPNWLQLCGEKEWGSILKTRGNDLQPDLQKTALESSASNRYSELCNRLVPFN